MHPSMMNVPELKLLSSSLSICSVSLMTDEEDKEGNEEGSQTINNNNNNTNRNMSKLKGWTLQSSLLTLWMDENSTQQSN